jgi:hypothetical protein
MANEAINLLVSEPWPIAVDTAGRMFKLERVDGNDDELIATQISPGVFLKGGNRPTFTVFQATPFEPKYLILAAGRELIKISSDASGTLTASVLGGNPPQGKFVQELDYHLLIAGYNDLDFTWSDLEEPEVYPLLGGELVNVNRVQKKKGDEKIENMIVFRREIYFFKTHSIEIWVNIGGELVFARRNFIEKGCGAPYSIVQANDTLYWFGDDGQFYRLEGLQPRIISTPYWRELDPLKSKEKIHGFDFYPEAVIRWISIENNRVFNYDYKHEVWSEDNLWQEGEWKVLPMNSHMVWEGEQYIGDYKRTGKIFHWDKEHLTDNGDEIRVYRLFQFQLSPNGTFTRVNQLRLRVQRGQGRDGLEDPQLFLRWKMDHGEWDFYEHRSLGLRGEYPPNVDVHNLGIGTEMSLEIVVTDPVYYLVTDCWITGENLG